MKIKILTCLAAFVIASETVATNVALFRDVHFCGTVDETTRAMTDGDRSTESGFVAGHGCSPVAFLTVDFGRPVYPHYVVVYEGRSDGGSRGQLDYFILNLVNVLTTNLCGVFPKLRHAGYQGMRVNCIYSDLNFISLKLTSKRMFWINIAEIEVYSFALETQDDYIWIHRGCYENITANVAIPLLDWKNCKTECKNAGVSFAAIKNNEECHCVSEYKESHHRPLRECDLKCSDSDYYYCGGKERYSLYMVDMRMPAYVTCADISDVPEELIFENFTEDHMTIAICISKCGNYSRALLQGGSTCICASDGNHNISSEHSKLNSNGRRDPRNCISRCSGDSETMCGGSFHFSVYSTCQSSKESNKPCEMFFKCSGALDHFGACKSGCQKNFIGEHCLERRSLETDSETKGAESVCNVSNPCEEILYSECRDEDGHHHACVCLLGVDNDTGLCEGIGGQECLLGFLCFLMTPTCQAIKVTKAFERVCNCDWRYVGILGYCIDVVAVSMAAPIGIGIVVLMTLNTRPDLSPSGSVLSFSLD